MLLAVPEVCGGHRAVGQADKDTSLPEESFLEEGGKSLVPLDPRGLWKGKAMPGPVWEHKLAHLRDGPPWPRTDCTHRTQEWDVGRSS